MTPLRLTRSAFCPSAPSFISTPVPFWSSFLSLLLSVYLFLFFPSLKKNPLTYKLRLLIFSCPPPPPQLRWQRHSFDSAQSAQLKINSELNTFQKLKKDFRGASIAIPPRWQTFASIINQLCSFMRDGRDASATSRDTHSLAN